MILKLPGGLIPPLFPHWLRAWFEHRRHVAHQDAIRFWWNVCDI